MTTSTVDCVLPATGKQSRAARTTRTTSANRRLTAAQNHKLSSSWTEICGTQGKKALQSDKVVRVGDDRSHNGTGRRRKVIAFPPSYTPRCPSRIGLGLGLPLEAHDSSTIIHSEPRTADTEQSRNWYRSPRHPVWKADIALAPSASPAEDWQDTSNVRQSFPCNLTVILNFTSSIVGRFAGTSRYGDTSRCQPLDRLYLSKDLLRQLSRTSGTGTNV